MKKIDKRVKEMVDKHMDSDTSDDEDVYVSDTEEGVEENADEENEREDLGDDAPDIPDDDLDDDEDEPSIVLNFELGRYERSKVLKMGDLQLDQYEDTLKSDPEHSDDFYYIDL